MERPIFSLDVETSGPLPGKHSLVSIGVHEILSWRGFYAELKPEPGESFERWPMETISDKLLCLDSRERFALANWGGWKIAVDALSKKGEGRKDALLRLKKWMGESVDVEDYDGYDVMAWPSSFDASFILASAWLSDAWVPCKFSWLCLSSVKRAVKTVLPKWNPKKISKSDVAAAMCEDHFSKSIRTLSIGKHNAYYDAVHQGFEWIELRNVLDGLRA